MRPSGVWGASSRVHALHASSDVWGFGQSWVQLALGLFAAACDGALAVDVAMTGTITERHLWLVSEPRGRTAVPVVRTDEFRGLDWSQVETAATEGDDTHDGAHRRN